MKLIYEKIQHSCCCLVKRVYRKVGGRFHIVLCGSVGFLYMVYCKIPIINGMYVQDYFSGTYKI